MADNITILLQKHFKAGGSFGYDHWQYCVENFIKEYNNMNQPKSKFEQLIEDYKKDYLKEDGFNNSFSTTTTATPSASGVGEVINDDPNVVQAKQNAIKKIQMDLTKKANNITNPY